MYYVLKKDREYLKNTITELYYNQKMSQKEVSLVIGRSQRQVGKIMKKLRIPSRSISESVSGELNPFFGRHHDSKYHKTFVLCGKAFGHSPESNEKRRRTESGEGNHFYHKMHTLEAKSKMSAAARLRWSNPDYVKSMCAKWHRRPNLSEVLLDILLQKNFPGKWKYTGDGHEGITVNCRIPDWIRLDDKKGIIELFGKMFHDPKFFPGRDQETVLKDYDSVGYKCLIIMHTELKHPQTIIRKVLQFEGELCVSS